MSGLVLAIPAIGFYLWAAYRQWLSLSGRAPSNRAQVLISTMIGALLHFGFIGFSTLGNEQINFEVFEVGSLTCWVMVQIGRASCRERV